MSRHRLRMLAIGFAIVVVVPIVACLGLAAVQPSSFRIERTREMAVDPGAVRAVLRDVERVEPAFSPREPGETPPVVTLSPQRTGVGAYFEHALPTQRTRFTIAELGDERVVYDVSIEGGPARSRFVAEFAPTSSGTALTLAIEGPVETLFQKILWPFVNLEGRVAPELEHTLAVIETAAGR